MTIHPEVQQQLNALSKHRGRKASFTMLFQSEISGDDWDRFIEATASRCYSFLLDCLGPFQMEPQPIILPIDDGFHVSGANASFEPATGQIRLCPDYIRGKPGVTLEKLLHELTHASLNDFPEGDPFYEEGAVDYSVFVMAHAPFWEPHRDAMIKAAQHNINLRRERAMKVQTDYDRKRWAGGLYFSAAYGPWILSKLRMAKAEGTLQW